MQRPSSWKRFQKLFICQFDFIFWIVLIRSMDHVWLFYFAGKHRNFVVMIHRRSGRRPSWCIPDANASVQGADRPRKDPFPSHDPSSDDVSTQWTGFRIRWANSRYTVTVEFFDRLGAMRATRCYTPSTLRLTVSIKKLGFSLKKPTNCFWFKFDKNFYFKFS